LQSGRMSFLLAHDDHRATVLASLSSLPTDLLLISKEGEQVPASRLLLSLHSPLFRELLASTHTTAISLPLSTEGVAALLGVLAEGRAFGGEEEELVGVARGAAVLGILLPGLQLGGRRGARAGVVELEEDGMEASGEEPAIGGPAFQDGKDGGNFMERGRGDYSEKRPIESNDDEETLKPNEVEEGIQWMKDKNKLSCVSCKIEFRSKYLLSKHIKKEHETLYCEVNQKPFFGAKELENLYKGGKASGPEEEKFACPECDFSSPRLAFLRTHAKFMHTGGR